MRRFALPLTLAALGLALPATLLPPPTHAQWSTTPHDALMIADMPDNNSLCGAQKLATDNYLTATINHFTSGGNFMGRNYLQLITPEGRKLWGEQGVPVCSPCDSSQLYSILVDDSAGGAFVFWWDERGTLPDKEIYGQHISADGQFLWDLAGRLIASPAGISPPTDYDACPDGEGGAYLVWGQESGTWSNGCVQRIDSRGQALWPQYARVADGYFGYPKICPRTGGGCYVTWMWWDNTLRAQRLDPSGRPLWPPNGVLFEDFVNSAEAKILSDTRGGFLYLNGGAHIMRVNDQAQVLWNNSVSQYTAFVQCLDFKLAPNGLIYSVYEKPDWSSVAAGSDVYAQCFDLAGNQLWGLIGRPVCALPRTVQGWAFLALTSHGFITRFTNGWHFGAGISDQYFQISDSAGHTLLEARGRPLYLSPEFDWGGGPLIISDGEDGAIAFLARYDSVLANRILPDGSLGYPPSPPPLDQPRGKILALGDGLIRYTLPQAGEVKLELFDLLGRRVGLVEEGRRDAGEHAVRLQIDGLASGFYILRLSAPGWREATRVVVVR